MPRGPAASESGSLVMQLALILTVGSLWMGAMMSRRSSGVKDSEIFRIKIAMEQIEGDVQDALDNAPSIARSMEAYVENQAAFTGCFAAGANNPTGFLLVSVFDKANPPARLLGGADIAGLAAGFRATGETCELFTGSTICRIQSLVTVTQRVARVANEECDFTFSYQIRPSNSDLPAFAKTSRNLAWMKPLDIDPARIRRYRIRRDPTTLAWSAAAI